MLLSENNLLNNLETTEKEYWQSRITLVENCPDNKYIKRVNNAGNIINGNLVMHNGILVDPLSYYQFPLLEMLIKNKGVHEPQEELIFSEVLKMKMSFIHGILSIKLLVRHLNILAF